MRIKKLQGGGFASFTPILSNTGSPAVRPRESEDKKDTEESKGLLDKDVYKKLMDAGGLSNDVNAFVESILELESTQHPYMSNTNRNSALSMIAKVNELIQSRKYWEDSMKNAKESGGLGEVAIDSSRRMFVRDKDNGIKAIGFAEYDKAKNKPQVLTVGELLNARQFDKQLVGNDSIFEIANQSIGIEKITDHVEKMMGLLSEASVSSERHYSKQQIMQQLKALGGMTPSEEVLSATRRWTEMANTPGEYIKEVSEESGKRKNSNMAFNYIWSTLDKASQNKLTATALLNGENDPKSLIQQMLYSNTESKIKSELSPETPSSVHGSSSSSGDSEKPITPYELSHNGKTGKVIVDWNEPSTGKNLKLTATGVFNLQNVDGKLLGMTTLGNVLKSDVGGLVDTGNVFFGEKKVTLNDLNNIIYDGSKAMRVYMPINNQGAPDYDKLQQVKELEQQVLADPDMTPEQINDFFKERGLDYIQVNNKKEYIINDRYKPFLLMYGYTGEGSPSTSYNGKIKALDSSQKNGVLSSLEDIWNKEKVEAPTGWFDWSTTLYKGAIAIQYDDNSSMYASALARNLMSPQQTLVDARIKKETSQGDRINANSSLIFE